MTHKKKNITARVKQKPGLGFCALSRFRSLLHPNGWVLSVSKIWGRNVTGYLRPKIMRFSMRTFGFKISFLKVYFRTSLRTSKKGKRLFRPSLYIYMPVSNRVVSMTRYFSRTFLLSGPFRFSAVYLLLVVVEWYLLCYKSWLHGCVHMWLHRSIYIFVHF